MTTGSASRHVPFSGVDANAVFTWTVAAAAAVLLGMTTPVFAGDGTDAEVWTAQASTLLDQMAMEVEEWGTISMSMPLLAQPGDVFGFNLETVGPQQYFEAARAGVQGSTGLFEQSVLSMGLGLSAQVSDPVTAAYEAALSQYRMSQTDLQGARADDAERAAYLRAAVALEAQRFVNDLPPDATQAQRDEAEAARLRYLAEHLPSSEPTPVPFPTAPTEGLPELDEARDDVDAGEATSVLSGASLSGFKGLLQGAAAPTLSSRAAISIAAGDTATEAIFRVLGTPELAAKFSDKKVLFGAAMVSVVPGWRTQQHFAAQVVITPEYEWVPARKETLDKAREAAKSDSELAVLLARYESVARTGDGGEAAQQNHGGGSTIKIQDFGATGGDILGALRPTKRDDALLHRFVVPVEPNSPMVVAATPMMDVEVLDQTASFRSQQSYSLALAVALADAGLKEQGKLFLDWSKRREKDLQARTSFAAVSALNLSGGQFGFQVGPRLDPSGGKKAGDERRLTQQAFPVLIIVGLDQGDLGLRFRDEGGLVPVEPRLKLRQTIRWLPLRPRSIFRADHRLEEETRLDLLKNLHSVVLDAPWTEDMWAQTHEDIATAKTFFDETRENEALTCGSWRAVSAARGLWERYRARTAGNTADSNNWSEWVAAFDQVDTLWHDMQRASCMAPPSLEYQTGRVNAVLKQLEGEKKNDGDTTAGGEQKSDGDAKKDDSPKKPPCREQKIPGDGAETVASLLGDAQLRESKNIVTILAACPKEDTTDLERLLEVNRQLERATSLNLTDEARQTVKSYVDSVNAALPSGMPSFDLAPAIVEEFADRAETLSALLLGSSNDQYLPVDLLIPKKADSPVEAKFTGFGEVTRFRTGMDAVVEVKGTNLDKIPAGVKIRLKAGNQLVDVDPTARTKTNIVAVFPAGNFSTPGPAALAVVSKNVALFSLPVFIEDREGKPHTEVVITRDAAGRPLSVRVFDGAAGDADRARMLEGIIREALKGDQDSAQFELSVAGSGEVKASGSGTGG